MEKIIILKMKDEMKSIDVYRPVAIAFLKEGRSDSVHFFSGRLFRIFGAKNEKEFVLRLTLY